MADVADEYRSSLSELNFNSKPHINMLTMLAEENLQHAPIIVKTIVDHINTVTPELKLPSLYLVDSIVKNVGQIYTSLFSKHLVELFTSVFDKVDENIRSLLFKLRSTWTGIFPSAVLLDLDKSVTHLDPAWPVPQQAHKNIHVNPLFLDKPGLNLPKKTETLSKSQSALMEVEMKKKQLVLLKALEEKKKKLEELRLKAALAPVESSKADIQKKLNARDPRLYKKVSPAAVTDSTTLQSVVVIPKENVKRKNEKGSLSPVSKKNKLDYVPYSSKKDGKNKPAGFAVNSKVNAAQNASNQQGNSTHTINSQEGMKSLKQPSEHGVSALGHSELGKSEHMSKYPADLKTRSDGILLNKPSVSLNQPNQPVTKILGSISHSVSKSNLSEEKNYCYNQQPALIAKEDVFDKETPKLEPPPLPPLFLGNEDKDYRILPKNFDDRNLNDTPYHKHQSLPVVKSFKLDGKERKVYFVNERSFAFLDDNIPGELTFEGAPQFVFIEGLPQPIELGFGGHEMKFEIDGKFHFIKFGTPAREVYIDDYPYEASFGGPPFTFLLENGKVCRIRISGSVPNVVLSKTAAYDLYDRFCQSNREFLQRFDNEPNINHDFSLVPNHDVDMRVNNGKFSSAFFDFPLERINDVNWQRIHVGNSQQTEWNVPKNSFETFKDVNPNFISQGNYSKESDWNMPPPLPPKQMINRFPGMPSSTTYGCSYGSVNKPLQQFSSDFPRSAPPNNGPFSQSKNSTGPQLTEASAIPKLAPPPLPPFLSTIPNTSCVTGLSVTKDLVQTSESYCNSTVPSTFSLTQTVVAVPPMNATSISMTGLITSVLATNTVVSSHMLSSAVPAQVPIINVSQQTAATTTTTVGQNTGPVNMNLILDQLVAAGIIGKNSGSSSSPPASTASAESEKNDDDKTEDSPKEDSIPEIVFESKCLKEFYPGVISALHNGSQCATCGMRFKEIQSELQYRRHLDWHFRRNQREKYGAKKPCSRRLFYEIKDWIQFKEFEDVDERAPSYFELQANGEQASVPSPEIVCSVACSDCESEKCAVCGEQFQLFWVEEEEEWHLKNAVKHNDQVYHPSCYEDYEKANNPVVNDTESSFEETKTDLKTEIPELDEEVSPTKVKDESVEGDLKEKERESGDKIETDSDENEKEENNVVVNEEKINKDEEKLEEESIVLEGEVKETEVVIKVEPMEIDEVENIEVEKEKSITDSSNSETTKTEELKSEIKAESVEEPAVKAEDTNEESVLASQSENVPSKSEDELEDIEFRPPTPDPRFQVLPPVSRGTEISNLCTIM